MQDFLESAAAQLGVGKDQVAGATGSILGLIQDNADPGDVQEMLSKVPGAGELIQGAVGGGDGGGGLLGAVGDLLGGGAGKALGAADILSNIDLDPSKLGGLLEMLQKYVQPLLGDDLLKRLLEKVPGLGDLLGQ